MLSAIAARKAARAAKLVSALQPPELPKDFCDPARESESDSERQIKSVLHPQKKSKRKPAELSDSERSSPRKKRRGKKIRAETLQNRYFEPQNDDSDGIQKIEDSSSDSDEDTDVVNSLDGELGDISKPQQVQKPQRAWSPSAPPTDSSDDAIEPEPSRRDAGYQSPFQMSFIPQHGKNVVYTDGSDTGVLSGRKGTIVVLEEEETMALLGVYSLTVLRGTVSAMGTELHASSLRSHTIFAPKCSPVPILKAKAMTSRQLPKYSLPEPISLAASADAVVLFLEQVHTGIEGLGRVCRTFEGVFDASPFGDDALNLSTAKLLPSTSRVIQPFQVPDSWQSAFSSLDRRPEAGINANAYLRNLEPLSLLVKGPKRTGKSTFTRTVVNRLLSQYSRVAYLECDIGQTEFTPPGLVSLHVVDRPIFGPPFTHPRLPYASHFIGASSPRDSPGLYLAAISALLHTYRLELQHPAPEDELYGVESEDDRIFDVVPLVVNTMGWLKGLGADLARRIEEMMVPSHIFSTQPLSESMHERFSGDSTNPARRTSSLSGDSPLMFEFEAIPPNPTSMRYSPADWRTIVVMSYFHSVPSPAQYRLLPPQVQPLTAQPYDPRTQLCNWDCQLPLLAKLPYAVSPASAIDNVALVGAGMEDVVPSEIGRVLNGAIVALVSREPDVSEVYPCKDKWPRLPYIQGSPPPDPSASNCIGLALIRGISPSCFEETSRSDHDRTNTEDDIIHVLTPIPLDLIAASDTRCLVKGVVELPVWGMLDYRDLERGDSRSYEVDMPYLQWSKSDAAGAERRRVRRNIMRKGQM